MSEFIKNTVDKNEVVIEKRTKKKLKKPSLYKVVMLNDDYTPKIYIGSWTEFGKK